MNNKMIRIDDIDQKALERLVSGLPVPGVKSNSSTVHQLLDKHGGLISVGAQHNQRVVVDSDGIPHVLNSIIGRVANCGHIVKTLDEVAGYCDYGHVLCEKHNLFMCSRCRRIICELEWSFIEASNELVCPHCLENEEGAGAVVGFIVLMLIIIFICVFSCG